MDYGANHCGKYSHPARSQAGAWATAILRSAFFWEWQQDVPPLSEAEQQLLDRVKANFTALMEDPPMLENSVKMVVLSPLLDLAGFYRQPFRIETETSIDLELEDDVWSFEAALTFWS
jgi:hypothetical protein